MNFNRLKIVFPLWALAWAVVLPLAAQNDECCIVEALNVLALASAVPDGAPDGRSLGLAGVFAPLADDAGAAFLNPSGLSSLSRPSMAMAATYGEGDDRLSPFIAFAYPKKRWTLGFYHVSWGQTLSGSEKSPEPGPPAAAKFDLEVNGFGLALAYYLHPSVYVGVGVIHTRMEFQGRQLLADGVTLGQTVEDEDQGLHAGILVKPNRAWSMGAFWRQKTLFSMRSRVEGRFTGGQARDFDLEGTSVSVLPSTYGLGFSYLPGWAALRGSSILLFQADRLERSKTLDTSRPVVVRNLLGDFLADPGGEFESEDETHYRLAVEHSFWGSKWVPALRGGIHLARGGAISFRPVRQTSQTETYLNAYPESRDTWHYALGTGILPREGMSLEFGAVYSESRYAYSLLFTMRL